VSDSRSRISQASLSASSDSDDPVAGAAPQSIPVPLVMAVVMLLSMAAVVVLRSVLQDRVFRLF
jgi:hypothetical protein